LKANWGARVLHFGTLAIALVWIALTLVALAWIASASAAPSPPLTVHLAGDSTLAEKLPEKRPETGWGEFLAAQFTAGSVVIDNCAKNGRSTRTFIEEGRWNALLEATKPGDVVLIQFGHNDASVEKPDRYTPPGDYTRNLERFVADVRARGAVPVLLTPVARRRFDAQGRLQASHGEYPDLVRVLAAREHVALVDMERRSAALLQEAGDEASKRWFLWLAPGANANYPKGVEDNTHFSPLGAKEMASLVVWGIEDSKINLRKMLKK